MNVFKSRIIMGTLLYKSDFINNLQLLCIPSRMILVCTRIILLTDSTKLLLSATIARSRMVSCPFFIPYHSEWYTSSWLRNLLSLRSNVWIGSLLRAGFNPIIAPMVSCMGCHFIMKITSRYHLVIISKSLTNFKLPVPNFAGLFTLSICNPWTINKVVV